MQTYLNLIQHSTGVEFDLDLNSGARVPPQLVHEGDAYHGTYLLPATPEQAKDMVSRMLAKLDEQAPPKVNRKKLQKQLKKFEVSPEVTH